MRARGSRKTNRKCSLVTEGGVGSYSAYVPELPTILVTGHSIDELTARATEAVGIYLGSPVAWMIVFRRLRRFPKGGRD
jgi:predicted RNase H-like HicB family nuclease